jgi:hypothetical protein
VVPGSKSGLTSACGRPLGSRWVATWVDRRKSSDGRQRKRNCKKGQRPNQKTTSLKIYIVNIESIITEGDADNILRIILQFFIALFDNLKSSLFSIQIFILLE